MPARTPARSASRQGARAARGTSFREAEPRPLVLLSGSDGYQAARAFDRIRTLAKAASGELEVHRFDAASYQQGELLLAASPSLFGGAALIEFHALESMSEAALKDLLGYAAAPDPEVILVAHHAGGNRGKSLLDLLKKQAAVIDVSPLKKDAEKADFVHQEFSAARRKIGPEAVRDLVAAVGSDLAELGSACRQLMEDTEGSVTQEQVRQYFGGRVEATGFAVADAAVAGQGAQAVSLLRHALATGVDPVPLVAALAMKVRHAAKVAGLSAPSAQLASELKMPPWQVHQAQEVARRMGPAALGECVQLLAATDAQVKGEGRDPQYAVERAVVTISRLAAHRG